MAWCPVTVCNPPAGAGTVRDGRVPHEPPGRVGISMQEKVCRVSATRMLACSPAFLCFAAIPRSKQ